MMTVQKELFTVRREIEWNAINSAVRLEILVFMIMIGPCGIRELAELMDRPADGLYHHMRKLVGAGLVVEACTRKVGTQTEVVYQTAATDITIDRNIKRKRTRDRVIRLFRTIMQHAQRTMETALRSGKAVLEKDNQNVKLSWLTTWLDDRQLAEIREHQEAIDTILREGLRQRKGQLFAVLTYLAPLVRARGANIPDNSAEHES